MRKSLVLVHRWVGIVAGLYVALIALSGIGMVFSTTFYEWEFGADKVSVPMQDRPYAEPDLWLAKAEAKFGKLPNVEGYFGPRATPMRISAPTIIYAPVRADGGDAHGVVTVNPYTGEPLAHFIAEDSWSMLPLKLHMSLFLPPAISSWMLVALSILIFGFALSGLYLWWPGRKRMKAAMVVPKPASITGHRRFHAGIGFWASPLLILAAVTGLMLTRFDVAEVVASPFGTSAEFDPAITPKAECAPNVAALAGDALATARAKYPGMELSSLFLPTPESPVHQIWLRPAQSTVPARGNVEVVVDAKCGTILFSRGDAEMKAGDIVLTYLVELHNGRLLGLFGEGLIVLQGIALATLPLAGISLFLRRRVRRKAVEKLRSESANDKQFDPQLPVTKPSAIGSGF
jgi:uncharacterized iron-regulated membrane protein